MGKKKKIKEAKKAIEQFLGTNTEFEMNFEVAALQLNKEDEKVANVTQLVRDHYKLIKENLTYIKDDILELDEC